MLYPATQINLDFAATILSEGDIIIYPTDTLYGFGVDATNGDAVRRLNALKGRHNSPMSIVLADAGHIRGYAIVLNEHAELIGRLLPGPYTVLLKKKTCTVADEVTGASPLIGIRVPAHPFITSLVGRLGKPITTTSINRHGENPNLAIEEIITEYPHILTFKDGEMTAGRESTILDLSGSEPKVVRLGMGEFPS